MKKDKLIELYKKALDNALLEFQEAIKKGGDTAEIKASILKNLLREFKKAKAIRGQLQQELIEQYINTKLEEYTKAKPLLSEKQQKYNFEAFNEIDNKEITSIYNIFNDKLNKAEKGIGRQIRGWFDKEQKQLTNLTNSTVRDSLTERFMGKSKEKAIEDIVKNLKDNIYFKLVDKNGNWLKMRLDSYAKLSLNTMFQQGRNTATINTVKQLETDLVIFSRHYWTCEVCAKYAEGRVYSVNKKNKEFPYLYDLVPGFVHGYNSIHPNCKHRLSGYYETGRSKEEREKIKKLSFNHTDIRSDKDKEFYDIKQKINVLNRRKNSLKKDLTLLNNIKQNEKLKHDLTLKIKNINTVIKKLERELKEMR